MAESTEGFGVTNYCVFGATLTISFGIGVAAAFKGNNSPEEFLMGNRNIGTIPVAMSLLSSFVSAVNYIGLTTEVYAYGMQISMASVGIAIGILIAMFVTLPVLFPLKLTSIHEYVELRFKSSSLRLLMMVLILINAIVYMSVCLYATSLAIAAVTPLSFVTYIFLIGVICTAYSTIGGIRAVVWTDVFQCIVMVLGLIFVVAVGIMQVGGVSELYAISAEGKRAEIFNMNPSIYERHTFYNTITLGACFYSAIYGVSQVNVQRMCAVSAIEKSRKVLAINAVGMVIIHFLICLGGLVIYAVYAHCDPFKSGQIEKKEEVLSFFVMDRLSFIQGLPGVFVAVLMASTLSTFSSIVNAQAAIIWEDFLSKFKVLSSVSPAKAALFNKFLTFIVGSAFIGMALLASKAASLVQLTSAVGGIVFGTIYGVFLLGICFPRSTIKGAWAGLTISCFLLSWIYIGSIYNVPVPELLPLSVGHCNESSLRNSSVWHPSHSAKPITTEGFSATTPRPKKTPNDSFLHLYVYGISYTLYSLIGPALCIFIGVLVSYATGPLELEEVDPALIATFLRKFYPKNAKHGEDLKLKECERNN